MVKVGKWIAKHKVLVLLIGLLLVIPSVIGIAETRVNYDLLSYLPDTLETVKGQDILVDEFGMGAFSMVIVENMDMKDVQKLEEKFSEVEHVKDVLWYDDVADLNLPVQMIPKKLREGFFKGNATMMIVLFDNTTSSDESMNAVAEMRKLANKQCFISGMSGVVNDIKDVALDELPVYVVIAAVLSFLVLEFTTESFLVPVFFLLSIGIAIIYNLGSNVFLGQVSYITKALTAVLQLGVTMDYSIFLLNSYEEYKEKYTEDRNRAMGHAIASTFKAVVGSSVTTVAGFAALCFMTFTLGLDLGVVMAKGVVLGVISCVTILPAFILVFHKAIEKTKHRQILPDFDKVPRWIAKHYKIFIAVFVILLVPAIYGQANTKLYYDLTLSLPDSLESVVAQNKISKEYDLGSANIILLDSDVKSKDVSAMLDEVKKVDGVQMALGKESVLDGSVPESFIPKDLTKELESDEHEMLIFMSAYKTGSDEANNQCNEIEKIIKKYDKNGMLVGEAACTRDLIKITNKDFATVSFVSIFLIFIIIALVFKSISLPIILVAVIEFAIFINMGIPFYTNTTLPFIASIVIGTIQLGATVDYAILMTNRYKLERSSGKDKKAAAGDALKATMKSVMVSAFTFFGATFGVGVYSSIDMISSLCLLMARGAIVSMLCVICILPAMYIVFDKAIVKGSYKFLD